MTLPAYLQNTPAKKLNENALLGIGSALPPHISIRGNTFTLVDASGATQVAGPVLDLCVADLSDVVCKQYYADKWTPDSNEPPACWSSNGIGPSREALEPQSDTCAACQHNVRGSAVSALSGAAIRACRDEKWLAVLIPSIPQVKFQFRLTPGSFKTWQSYVKQCEGNQTEISNVLTRVTFQAGTNGVLLFQPIAYIDENTAALRNAGYNEKAFDVLVGRTDQPRQGALPAPTAAPQTLAPPAAQQTAAPGFGQFPSPSATQPPQGTPTPFPNGGATAASPSSPAPRRRRTKAEIEAANAAQLPQGAPQQAPIAPFRPQAAQEVIPPAQPAAPGFMAAPAQPAFGGVAPSSGNVAFGMAAGVPPNPELQKALDGLFTK